MKKKNIVKSKILFNEIIHAGNKKQNKYYIISYLKKDEMNNNYGVAVGTKIGNAVKRNRIRRQIKSIIDNNYNLFPNYHNYIIISKKEILKIDYTTMQNELVNLIKEIANEK